ncbi:MAG: PAS domain S-box protein, partial [Thermoanaerobaculia bacterium]|nr:PAS domain S-box protein [Thermoanaerobaculia bacterium]
MTSPKTDRSRPPGDSAASENRYREMFEHSVAGMYRSSAEGRLLDANQALADILGYHSVDELYELDLGRDVYADPEERDRLLARVERDDVVSEIEIELKRRDGSTLTALGSMRGIRDTDGRLSVMEGTLIDISERRRATRSLLASEQRYRRLVENLTDGVFETTPDGRMLRANQALVEMLGYDSEEELLSVPVSEQYVAPGRRDRLVEKTLASGGIRNEELALRRKDGSVVYCLQNSSVIYDHDGEPVRFEGTLTDLSDLRRRETERRELEARRERQNRALLELTRAARPDSTEESHRLVTRVAARTLEVANVGVWLFDGESRLRCACLWDSAEESYSTGAEIDTTDFPVHFRAVQEQRFLAVDDALADPLTAELREGYLEPRGIASMLDVPIRSGGRLIGILCHEHVGIPRRWSEDEIDFAASMASWLSQETERHERRQAQEELRTSEEKYRDLFESTVSGFFRTDPEGRFLAANPAFLEMLGYDSEEDLRSVNLAEDIYVDRGRRDALTKAIAREPLLRNVEAELRRRDGSIVRVFGNIRRVVDAEGKTIHYEGSFVDVTERAELELQLRQSQKMEALGKLAGGVAHDFNNLITVMLGYIDLATGKVEPGSSLKDDLEQIRDAADRAASMTRHLLAYTRQQVLHPRVVDLNDVVEDVSQLLDRLIGEDIDLELDLADDLYPVRVDPGQLQQVLINLAVNARDAMRRGGRLTIGTRTERLDRPRRMPDFVIESGRYAVITVSDEGEGMDDETRS